MFKHTAYQGFYTLEVHETAQGQREVLRTTDSVSVLFYDVQNKRIILVRQPRESMISLENPEGLITETVAGRFDVTLGVLQLIIKEAKEEIGATITEDDIELLNNGKPMALSAGAITEKCYLAFVEIKPEMIEEGEREFGAEGEGEKIRRVYVHEDELNTYICEDVRVFALIQYIQNRHAREALNRIHSMGNDAVHNLTRIIGVLKTLDEKLERGEM